MNRLLKKWAYLSVAAALAAIIGCGGGGGGHRTSGGGTTTTVPGTAMRVNLTKPNGLGQTFGRAEFLYLTGQGVSRRAAGDLSAVIRRIQLEDQYGLVAALSPETALPLRAFTSQIAAVDVPFSSTTNPNSRLFESLELSFLKFYREEDSGPPTPLNPPTPRSFPARIRVLPGRNTSVPILLNDAMFTDDGSGTVQFNEDEFRFRNLSDKGYIDSFLTDFVAFDLSGLANTDRPQLSTGEFANRVYMSGDNIAISAGGQSGSFEELTADASQPIIGAYGPQNLLRNTPGTYNLTQIDPTDLTFMARITSLQGIWRDYTTVLTGIGTFEVLVFPTVQDNASQEMAVILRDGSGTITQFYFGHLNLDLGRFQIFPVKDIVNADATGELDGTISNLVKGDGSPTTSPDNTRFGTYTFTTGTLPTGFQTTGTFVVFRQ
ncbi:hypothetical protein [Fimbriimonas ginsengisoli]|nr:hypothetical protein [Fimbriimonas ginsengisoli]